jgi:hypothetical protein
MQRLPFPSLRGDRAVLVRDAGLMIGTVDERYRALLAAGEIEPDPGQERLIAKLTGLEARLAQHRLARKSSSLGWLFGGTFAGQALAQRQMKAPTGVRQGPRRGRRGEWPPHWTARRGDLEIPGPIDAKAPHRMRFGGAPETRSVNFQS